MMNEKATQSRDPNPFLIPAAILSSIAGLWMLIGYTWMHGMDWEQMHEGHMMHSMRPWLWHHSFTDSYVTPMGWPWPGVVAGLAVLISSVLLYVAPQQRVVWGIVILASSALILLTSMGGLVPGVLGIIGGVLALLKPSGAPNSDINSGSG